MSGNVASATTAGLLPRRFEFQLEGDPSHGSLQLRWTAGKVEYQVIPPDADDPDEERTVALFLPSEQQWRAFWRAIDEIGVWTWPHQYRASDGKTSWRLELLREDHEVRASGVGAYPRTGSPLPTPEFRRLLEALRCLVDAGDAG